ncbi:MAG TPA: type IX secretion system sortase PorU [Bacteroidales bacterium]|nr:type IX secretion system sortase PorU [Bacteroidales bacterium]
MRYLSPIIILLFSLNNVILCSPGLPASEQYASRSVLSSGIWFKMAVREEGVYKITFSRLKQLGLEFPSNPRIYGNNAGQLSYYNDNSHPDDLEEIAVLLYTGADGVFNEGDYLLFYAQKSSRWFKNPSSSQYIYRQHNYSDSSYYFITSGPLPGKMITAMDPVTGPPDYQTSVFDALYVHEVDYENLIKSGREWFQPVSALTGITITPGFKEVIPAEGIKYTIRALARASVPTTFRLYEGTTVQSEMTIPEVNLFSTTGSYAGENITGGVLTPLSGSPEFEIKFINNGEQSARGWLDYVSLQARSNIVFDGKFLGFSDLKSVSPGRVSLFSVRSSLQAINIWDVTDPFNPKIINYSRDGDYVRFAAKTDSLRRFIAFLHDNAPAPVIRNTPLPNQDLHGSGMADMIIISHPMFLDHSRKLAEMHVKFNSITSLVVTPEEIYNEFSGGIPDIVALRNFVRMKFLQQSGTEKPLRYLLLFGDGSYDNRKQPPANPNFIPTYQSKNSVVVVSSFTSDDFYGLLEDGEGEAEGTEDIGIGRLPASDTAQASVFLSKIRRYMDPASAGDWRNVIVFAADDEDGNTHMNDAEGLSSLVETNLPRFNIEKIYLDAFRQVSSVSGQSYPEAETAINNRINAGCLIFNYSGHGNETGLAHERVVKTQNINSWRNYSRLPLFITATCEFGRFDDAELNPFNGVLTGRNSAGELVLLNPGGGGIALMTTTRLVYSAPNYTLNRNILDVAFQKDSAGNPLSLGDIIRKAKNNSGTGMNKRNFTLLGDPALRLAYPWHGKVITDSINNRSIAFFNDTLKALSYVTIAGHIEDNEGLTAEDFNGLVKAIVYDKKKNVLTLANDGGQPMEFSIRSSVLFSGRAEAKAGRFRFSFVMPRDIDFTFGKGMLNLYANDQGRDMNGSYSDFITGGFNKNAIADTTGPEIRIFLNDTLFRNGDYTDPDPVLLVRIADTGGINTTGAGIGHDLTAWLNNDRTSSFILNNYFETETGDYSRGHLRYPLYDIPPGLQTVTVRAWDNYNNSATGTLKFFVRTEKGFLLENLINYPNPFTDGTSITGSHNRPGTDMTIRIEIADMSGRKIKVIEETIYPEGYKIPPVFWDGTTEGGKKAGRGIYNYVVTLKTQKGEVARSSGRMIIL